MTITSPPCGPQCGISAGREGHCDCKLCHDNPAPAVITRNDLLAEIYPARTPMCGRWYIRAGDYRPWDGRAGKTGCICGVSAHALPGQLTAVTPLPGESSP